MSQQKQQQPGAMPMSMQRKTNVHIQQMKEKGEMISMVGTAHCDPFWTMACERAGVDMVRYTTQGENSEMREENMYWHTRNIRKMAPNINLNAVMQSRSYADKYTAVKVASTLVTDGADNVLAMGITNDTLKYMADNYIPVFGHVGCLSGWYSMWHGGYRRVGKTAEDAMKVFRMAYEYQENGMIGMTIELSSAQLTTAISKKLRVPVISVAASGEADGAELVIFDLLGFQPKSTMAKHSKCYAEFFEGGIKAFTEFDSDVKNKVYPAEEHGWSMDEKEFDKFLNELEQKY